MVLVIFSMYLLYLHSHLKYVLISKLICNNWPKQLVYFSIFRHVTDYINTLQGVLIFMVLVLFRKKALRALAVNPIIGNKFPKSWQRLDDGEYSSDEEALSENKWETMYGDKRTKKKNRCRSTYSFNPVPAKVL